VAAFFSAFDQVHARLDFLVNVAGAQQFMKTGRLKGLGISSATRASGAPDVPTFIESGFPGFVVDSWVGILAPANTPRSAPSTSILRKCTWPRTNSRAWRCSTRARVSTSTVTVERAKA
jgi:hypothetical protein